MPALNEGGIALKNAESNALPRFLTIPAAAKASAVSARYLRDLHRNGLLPGFYVGNRFYVNAPALADLLEQKCRADSTMPDTAFSAPDRSLRVIGS